MQNSSVYKWALTERILVAAISFGGNIALARLLSPDDFGLLAMIAIFTAVAYDISSCGLSDGLIHKLNPSRTDYSTVLIFNSGLGFIFGLTFVLIAPTIARFFGHDELVTIMRILGVCFFIQTFGFVQETKLRKDLAMKKLCLVRVGAALSALILGLILALSGMDYWALVATQIFVSVFTVAYYLLATRWFPGFKFSTKSFKEFFSYGIHLMLAYISTIIGRNINTFILGRFFPSPATSGVYYQGAKLANVPFSVTEASINAPFFVVVSNEKDPANQRSMIENMCTMIWGINGSLMLFIILAATPIITLLYGSKWAGAIPILQILAAFEFLTCIKYFYQTVCKVKGSTTFIRNITVTEITVQLCLLAIAIACKCNIHWIAMTQIGGVFVTVCIYSGMYIRYMNFSFLKYLKSIIAPISVQLIAFAIAHVIGMLYFTDFNALLACIGYAAIYTGICIGVFECIKPQAYITLRSRIFKK